MKFKVLSLLLSSALALAACNNGDDTQSKKAKEETKTTSTTKESKSKEAASSDEQAIDLKDIKTTPEQAIQTAKKEVSGALESISFEKDNNQWIYDVNILDKQKKSHEIKINANNNKVIHKETDSEIEQNEQTFDYGQFTSIDKVFAVAKKSFDGKLKEWSLSHDDGTYKYSLELQKKDGTTKEFEFDAKNLKLLSTEK